jgi:hypothetical protein
MAMSDDLLVTETLMGITESEEDYLEADVACEALAACEVISRLKGNWGLRNSYSETVDRWVLAHPTTVSPDLVQTAIQAIDRILTSPSELLELWQEGDASEWLAAVADLRARVQA